MLFYNNERIKVEGTVYELEYAITQREGQEEAAGRTEYGICCWLSGAGTEISVEEVKGVTTDFEKINRIFGKVKTNQVFPAHLRDVLEDFLIAEQEVKEVFAF